MLTIGSLFSGIGGLELGLERAGLGPVVWQVEIEPFCRRVLEKHWPGVERFDDIKEITKRQLTSHPACYVVGQETDNGFREIADVDLICGGFPCQPFSTASRGRRVAEDLWPEMLKIVRLARPRFVVAENVARPPIERAADDLRQEGYSATAIEVAASLVGAPHDRPRWFVVAHPYGESESRRAIDAEVARVSDLSGVGRWQDEPDPLGMDDGIPPRMDRLRALGNAVPPQVAEVIGRVVLALERARK